MKTERPKRPRSPASAEFRKRHVPDLKILEMIDRRPTDDESRQRLEEALHKLAAAIGRSIADTFDAEQRRAATGKGRGPDDHASSASGRAGHHRLRSSPT